MDSSNLFPFSYRGQVSDANDCDSSGMYRIYGGVSNGPSFNFGVLLVFNAYGFVLQIANDVGNATPAAKFRTRNSQGVWSNWTNL